MVVNTRRGGLGQEEVDAIVDIVASAVHGMEPNRVTVTDSNGRLLNSGSQDGVSARARRELELVQQKENEYRTKIDSILMPILGPENFTSQVDVSMDFTAVEQTAKRFNPDLPSLRSEMTVENNSVGGSSGGIPGAFPISRRWSPIFLKTLPMPQKAAVLLQATAIGKRPVILSWIPPSAIPVSR